MPIRRIDHVQIAIPVGGEAQARGFYTGVLGLVEIPKPPVLATRGGLWFQLADVQLHLGADPAFAPARKAHVGLEATEFNTLAARCEAAGFALRIDSALEGRHRFFIDDPFGNRVEVLEAA
jgi:catechol 2,3-dioxygenase-like lactoylglutathione lyase family enzyme